MSYIILVSLLLASVGSSIGDSNDQVGSRIGGGQPANLGQYPFIVSIRKLPKNAHHCGGSIINPYWILTAAHCVDKPDTSQPKNLVVVAGSVTPHLDGERRRPIQIVHHPEFNEAFLEGGKDIGFLKLEAPFSQSKNIAPIRFGDVGSTGSLIVMGWGHGSEDRLKYATVQVLPNCDNNPALICGQTGDGNSCAGDSGGPVINGRGELVGIVSFNYGQPCTLNKPSGYTRVASYLQYIQQVVGSQ